MPAPRVVLDTNVFIAAAFRPGSDSGRLVEAARSRTVLLIWNEQTRRETETLLRKIPPISWEAVADLFLQENRWPGRTDVAAYVAVPDPEDRKFAALAAAADATLVSLDRHLLDADLDGACEVVVPGDFLDRLEGES